MTSIGMVRHAEDIASKTAVSDHHPDADEGVKAFAQKRKPQFNKWLEPKQSKL